MENSYDQVYSQSLDHPERFWADAAEDVHWYKNGMSSLTIPVNPFTGGSPAVLSTFATMR